MDLEDRLEYQSIDMVLLDAEKQKLLKEAQQIKSIPGFRVEVLTESERDKLHSEISNLKTAKSETEKNLTMLKNTDDIRAAMETILMMFLSKKEDAQNQLSPKQEYLIKYLFGDYATKGLKDVISEREREIQNLKRANRE